MGYWCISRLIIGKIEIGCILRGSERTLFLRKKEGFSTTLLAIHRYLLTYFIDTFDNSLLENQFQMLDACDLSNNKH